MWFGWFLIIIGPFYLLKALGFELPDNLWNILWPTFLLVWGFSILNHLGKQKKRRFGPFVFYDHWYEKKDSKKRKK